MAPPPPPCPPPFASWPQPRPVPTWHHPQATPPTPPEHQPAQSSSKGREVKTSFDTMDTKKEDNEVITIEVEGNGELDGSASTTNLQ